MTEELFFEIVEDEDKVQKYANDSMFCSFYDYYFGDDEEEEETEEDAFYRRAATLSPMNEILAIETHERERCLELEVAAYGMPLEEVCEKLENDPDFWDCLEEIEEQSAIENKESTRIKV